MAAFTACSGGTDLPDADGGLVAVDSGAAAVDSGADAVDSGVDPVDGGSDAGPPPEDDAGEPEGCPAGYAGAACDECAEEYQDENDDGECLPGCEATGTLAMECGAGECAIESGTRVCLCDAGYAGDACETCAPGYELDADACVLGSPPAGAFLWLDADDVSSITIGAEGDISTGRIASWRDTRGGFSPRRFDAAETVNQPLHKSGGLNGRRVVRFDGTEDWLVGAGGPATVNGAPGPFENVNEYTIILVGYAVGSPQVLLSGFNDGKHGLLLQSEADDNLRFLHRSPLSDVIQPDEDNLITTSGEYSATAAQILTFTRTADSHGIGAGVGNVAADSLEPAADAFDDGLLFALGRLKTGVTNIPRYLQGDLAEVLIYTRSLDEDELAHVHGYLAAKWGLAE